MKTETFDVPQGLLNVIAEYLSKRPYIEVKNLMDGLQLVRIVEEEKNESQGDTTES